MKVHSFESMAAVDGEGIRFCVFLAGCPLRCVYCHNPDTQRQNGRDFTPEEIVKKALRYKPYFKNGGGVTFSGGEPLLQSDEIVKCARLLKQNGIGYVLDTCLALPLSDSVKDALEGADMILADLKFATDADMKRFTGGKLSLVLDALKFIASARIPCRIRTVVVPGINDTKEALCEYKKLFEDIITPEKWELLPFHTLGFYKYDELGILNPLKNTPPLAPEVLEKLKEEIKK